MKIRTHFITILFILFSISIYSQLEFKDYANCQKKTFRINKIMSLTSNDGNYNAAIKYLEKDTAEKDFEYYLSNSLFKYIVYGKQKAYNYLKKNEFTNEEFHKAKVWLALMTNNSIEYIRYNQEFKALFPNSNFLLKMKIKEYLINNKSNIFDRNEKREQKIFKSIDSLMNQNNLSNFDIVFFSIAKLDINKNIIYDKKNRKLKSKLRKIAKKYPNEIWKPYLDFALAKDNFLIQHYGSPYNDTNPTREEMANWTAFHDFLDTNPFFDKTKLTSNYSGLPIIYYPRINNENELKIALNVINNLINKYPGIINLKNIKLLIIKIFKDMFSNKQEMSQHYLSTLIDLYEYNGDSGILLHYIIPQYEYDEDLLNELFTNLEITDLLKVKKQLQLSLKKEPEHLNLLQFKEEFEKFMLNHK